MNVPPAATYRSRIANEVASSAVVPKRMAPRLSTLTSRRVCKSVPIMRYFIWFLSGHRSVPGVEHESGRRSALQVKRRDWPGHGGRRQVGRTLNGQEPLPVGRGMARTAGAGSERQPGFAGSRGLGPGARSRPSAKAAEGGRAGKSGSCPGWDSNPHCTVFETADSADWSTGAGPAISAGEESCGRRQSTALGTLVAVSPTPVRVVIAEDEALIRLDLKEMLEEEGYEIAGEASDGERAVELAASLRPDLMILDVKMPVLDGISAAEQIAAEHIAPVVILTAFSQRELVERARDAGAMAYLVKPFTKADLVPTIEIAVSRFQELSALGAEVGSLRERLEVRKLLDRAKGRLQVAAGLTEPEAFRWIQKASMDRRVAMRVVAEEVLAGALPGAPAEGLAADGSPAPAPPAPDGSPDPDGSPAANGGPAPAPPAE